QQSLDFQAKLHAAGDTCDLMVLPGAGHGLADWERLAPDYTARMVAWLDRQLRPVAPAP
ncbi:MAG: prolyl oligopeptidase family serine peptidase, partial [Oleiharenicola lentus]